MNVRLVTLSLCLLATLPAHAEKADRDKPMLVEAGKVSIDDAKKIQILEGDVVITKGSMVLKAERVIITEDRYGFQKGTAFSGKKGLAYFRQKREGKDEYVEGEAERIEYDTNTEVAELFHRAWVKSGEDQVKGDYIWYDAVNEKYLVTAGETRTPTGAAPRVRAVIQPKNKETEPERPANRGERLQLKGAAGLGVEPAQE
ncbi:lipopolysaccharide transport periplasmic protein LptA [Dechloromonas agitata]|uniref:lipopolysaccharide transport periplasmic protein LptA n=1 Tax=Dechloromonas agitata TaxID=73030 RepID=UPI0004800CA1|nr:lipopolysaccharide transport periplasmic protein LptA [Dechloromonas agitata]MDE1545009.1 lipopolysaccharide transport periplasmic protein LptA [Dechloromonas agitata]